MNQDGFPKVTIDERKKKTETEQEKKLCRYIEVLGAVCVAVMDYGQSCIKRVGLGLGLGLALEAADTVKLTLDTPGLLMTGSPPSNTLSSSEKVGDPQKHLKHYGHASHTNPQPTTTKRDEQAKVCLSPPAVVTGGNSL